MTAIRRAGILLRGLSAAVILVALVAGVPARAPGHRGQSDPRSVDLDVAAHNRCVARACSLAWPGSSGRSS